VEEKKEGCLTYFVLYCIQRCSHRQVSLNCHYSDETALISSHSVFTAQHCASAVYAVVICPSVWLSMTSRVYQNGQMEDHTNNAVW